MYQMRVYHERSEVSDPGCKCFALIHIILFAIESGI